MKTENLDISNLLTTLSGELLGAYEKKNLNGKRLFLMNNEYQKATRTKTRLGEWPNIASLFLLPVGLVCGAILCLLTLIVLGFSHMEVIRNRAIAAGVISAVVLLSHSALVIFLKKKLSSAQKTITKYDSAIGDFMLSTKALNPSGRKGQVYTRDYVYLELQVGAINVLYAEKAFDEARLLQDRNVPKILQLGNLLEEQNKQLAKTFENAKKFGLEFEREKLFSDAKRLM